MKQTAVEWLVNEANLLENNGWILPLIEQAKEMEKEQAKNTFNDQDMINFLKSVFGMEDFDYEKALENFKNK